MENPRRAAARPRLRPSMSTRSRVSIGQYSDRGRKPNHQDAHGARVPDEPLASLKGIALALADDICSSDVSQVASQAAVAGFLEDYYCTSDAWSVKTSAERVLEATNAYDLRHPSAEFTSQTRRPLIERNPAAFWKRGVDHPGADHRAAARVDLSAALFRESPCVRTRTALCSPRSNIGVRRCVAALVQLPELVERSSGFVASR